MTSAKDFEAFLENGVRLIMQHDSAISEHVITFAHAIVKVAREAKIPPTIVIAYAIGKLADSMRAHVSPRELTAMIVGFIRVHETLKASGTMASIKFEENPDPKKSS